MSEASALYVGRVTHRRLRPRPHSLAYRGYWLLLDLDEIDSVSGRLRLFSHNRFNLFSFYDADHASGSGKLRPQIERHLSDAGIDIDGGAIRLLTMPRLLGYVFNPLSIYFCHHRDGTLAALLYEVSNTFGERHSYLIAVSEPENNPIRQRCEKLLYVSPFLGMDMRYDFHVIPPGQQTSVTVRAADASGDVVVATLNGVRTPLSDARLLRVFVTHPLLTAKVTLGIHWEALRLWLKGMRLQPRPSAPETPVTSHSAPIPRKAA